MRDFTLLLARLKEGARLMVGVPDYDAYVRHCLTRHPELPVMTYEQFFRDRQDSRYDPGRGRIGCC